MNTSHRSRRGKRRRARGYEAQWREAAKHLALRNVLGLVTQCPKCSKPGTAISKWVKGMAIKPVYVCHANGNGYFKACRLTGDKPAVVREVAAFGRDDVVKTIRMGRPFVLFSGGTDSLCLLQYMAHLARRANRTITAIHADTTAGFPEVEQYVTDVCKHLDIALVTVRPPQDYFDLAKRWGIPGVRSRWCCETLKIAPIRRYLATVNAPKVVFDGIRAAESHLRGTYLPVWFHPAFRCLSVSPIFYWSDEKVRKYIAACKLPQPPTAEMGTSGECWCGAYKCKDDFLALLKVHPDIFDKLVEVERAQRGKFTFLFEKGRQVPLTSLKGA